MIDDLHNEKREDLFKCGVYTITNLVNGKFYLGSTSNTFRERWRKHLNALKKGLHHSIKLQKAFNKYGEKAFLFEIVEVTIQTHSSFIEQYWMNMLNPVKLGYNVSYSTTGGCKGCKLSKEHKEKLSKANKNNTNFKGYKHSDKSKQQASETLKKFYSENGEKAMKLKKSRSNHMKMLFEMGLVKSTPKKPILQLDLLTNEIIKEWESATDVEKETGFKATSIIKVCRGKGKKAYNFKWVYKNTI